MKTSRFFVIEKDEVQLHFHLVESSSDHLISLVSRYQLFGIGPLTVTAQNNFLIRVEIHISFNMPDVLVFLSI